MKFLVEEELLQEIFKYLITKPCQETMSLVLKIQALKPHEENPQEVPAGTT